MDGALHQRYHARYGLGRRSVWTFYFVQDTLPDRLSLLSPACGYCSTRSSLVRRDLSLEDAVGQTVAERELTFSQ